MQMLFEIFFSPAFYPRTVFRTAVRTMKRAKNLLPSPVKMKRLKLCFFFKIRTQKKIDKNLLVEMEKLAFVDAAGWGEIYQSSKFAT